MPSREILTGAAPVWGSFWVDSVGAISGQTACREVLRDHLLGLSELWAASPGIDLQCGLQELGTLLLRLGQLLHTQEVPGSPHLQHGDHCRVGIQAKSHLRGHMGILSNVSLPEEVPGPPSLTIYVKRGAKSMPGRSWSNMRSGIPHLSVLLSSKACQSNMSPWGWEFKCPLQSYWNLDVNDPNRSAPSWSGLCHLVLSLLLHSHSKTQTAGLERDLEINTWFEEPEW